MRFYLPKIILVKIYIYIFTHHAKVYSRGYCESHRWIPDSSPHASRSAIFLSTENPPQIPPPGDHAPLIKCKLIKVEPSSLKLNHFKLDWLATSLPPLHFSFPSLAHPRSHEDDLPLMRNRSHLHN